MNVARVRWPAEADALVRLRAADRPRLIFVEEGAAPPVASSCLEDWVRLPASEVDVSARIAAIRARFAAHGAAGAAIDEHGVVRVGDAWVALPPVEARLAAAMIARPGSVVGREALVRAGWPGRSPDRNALDVHVLRIRRRLAPLGITIRTVRSRGYLLETSGAGQEAVSER